MPRRPHTNAAGLGENLAAPQDQVVADQPPGRGDDHRVNRDLEKVFTADDAFELAMADRHVGLTDDAGPARIVAENPLDGLAHKCRVSRREANFRHDKAGFVEMRNFRIAHHVAWFRRGNPGIFQQHFDFLRFLEVPIY